MYKRRNVIIGIDGVPYHIMEELSDQGIMPNFKELRKDGIFKKMESSLPEISSVSWSSIITGKNPGEHGIFGFTDILPGTYTMSFPNFKNLKEKPFWEKDVDKKHVIINVPATYPPNEINGFIVSGFVSLDMDKAVQPHDYLEMLNEIEYKIDVDSKKAHKSISMFLNNLFKVHDKRVELYRKLWDKIDWDNFMLVFTGSDRLEHFLINAYGNPDHEFHKQFLEYFKNVDDAIGEINEKMKQNDSLFMLSDHGMEEVKYNVNLNTFLENEGFLLLDDKPNKRYNNIKKGSKAFALDPSRIYYNKIDRFPNGGVKKSDEEQLTEGLISAFKGFKLDNTSVIQKIYKKDEIYHGKYLKKAPDLVLLPNSGFSLNGHIGKEKIFEKPDKIVGMHTQLDAFLYVKKNENREIVPKNPNVEDFNSIIEKAV
jgi:predicted AlkP superfamily phosphohydrolase/phosphomutase